MINNNRGVITIKSLLKLFTIIFTLSFIIACSSTSDDVTDETTSNTEDDSTRTVQVNEDDGMRDDDDRDDMIESDDDDREVASTDDQTYMEEKLESSFLKEIEVDIKFPNDKDYEFDIKRDDGKIEAKVKDDFSNNEIHSREAFDFIYDRVNELSIEKDTSFDSIKEQIISAFDLPNDYTEFEVGITFQDGTKVEYEN